MGSNSPSNEDTMLKNGIFMTVSSEFRIRVPSVNNHRGIIAGERRRDFVLLTHGGGMGGKWGVRDS